MASRKRPDETLSISVLISKLRDSSDSADFDEVEEKLVVREMRLKKEHDKKTKELEEERRVWKDKYEKLLEKAKRWGVGDDEKTILDLQRRNKMLHEGKMKMMKELESAVSRVEDEKGKMMNILGEKPKGRSSEKGNGESDDLVLDLGKGFDSVKVNEGITDLKNSYLKKSSGIGNVASDAIVIIDSDDESAGETLSRKKDSKKDECDCFLTPDGVAKMPQMLKRKQAPSSNVGNNKNDDEDTVLDHIPISERIRKKGKKVMGSSSLPSSAFSDHGKEAEQSSCDPLILRKSEENKRKKQKSLPISAKSHAFGNHDSTDDGKEASSNNSLKAEFEELNSLYNVIVGNAKK